MNSFNALKQVEINDSDALDNEGNLNLDYWRDTVRRQLAIYFRNAAINRFRNDGMKTTVSYLQNWLTNKPGLANYLNYNKSLKKYVLSLDWDEKRMGRELL